MDAAAKLDGLSHFEQLRYAREILRTEGEALLELADHLQGEFCAATNLLSVCRGSTIVTGMGKAGLVGQKITATLASTGTRSHFLHPGEAVHGDLGRVDRQDVVLALSFSGETEEVVRLLPALQAMPVPVVAITGRPDSTLGRGAAITISLGSIREACSLGLAPSTSTTAMLALGDALALVLCRMRRFGREDFARFHPGGSLGRKLARVEEVMRPLSECRITRHDQTIREVLVHSGKPGRRTGAIMLTDGDGRLVGVFTDSDLSRMLENCRDDPLAMPVRDAMTRAPKTIRLGSRLSEALFLLGESKISELPVVDEAGKPVGLIDITDVVSLLPASDIRTESRTRRPPSTSGPQTLPFPSRDEPA